MATIMPDGKQLYLDGRDGLGILGGSQEDEIDGNEMLSIEFDDGFLLSETWITNLFDGSDGNQSGGEWGRIQLNLGEYVFDFHGNHQPISSRTLSTPARPAR